MFSAIQVLNHIPNVDQTMSIYELFTKEKVDYHHEFWAEWGEQIRTK
jgi:hypothetical protein